MNVRELVSKPRRASGLVATECGLKSADGRRFYRVPVRIKISGVDRHFWEAETVIEVIAESAPAAANWVRDIVAREADHPVEIDAWGPRGGQVGRFIGWESLIGGHLFAERSSAVQLELPGICPRPSN